MHSDHLSTGLLERYFMNLASEDEIATVERHLFACHFCFTSAASLDADALVVSKACSMLGDLAQQGTRVLTIAPSVSEKPFSMLRMRLPGLDLRYSAAAAAILMTVTTLSVRLAEKDEPRTVYGEAAPRRIQMDYPPLTASAEPALRKASVRKRKPAPEIPLAVNKVRFERPFMPPSRERAMPELVMTPIPPPVVAARPQPALVLAALPQAPKRRVRRSRRVLTALASPFKKLGGALATVVVGRADTPRYR